MTEPMAETTTTFKGYELTLASLHEALKLVGYDRREVGGEKLPEDPSEAGVALLAELLVMTQAQLAAQPLELQERVGKKYYHLLRAHLFSDGCACGEDHCGPVNTGDLKS